MFTRKLLLALLLGSPISSFCQQTLTLQEALELSSENYGALKASKIRIDRARLGVEQARRVALPNVNVGIQQVYGTINGNNGPLYGFGGLASGAGGPALEEQNWNAGFGALYLTNVNWDIFTFGKNRERTNVAKSEADYQEKIWLQELFEHRIKVSSLYLQWIAALELAQTSQNNLLRADTIVQMVSSKVEGGLLPGAYLSMAKAERSSASIAFTRAGEQARDLQLQLLEVLGIEKNDVRPDLALLSKIPTDPTTAASHPEILRQESVLALNSRQMAFTKRQYYPSVGFIGILQTRASGFGGNYFLDQTDFTRNYFTGITPTRVNYLLGLGLTWNFTQTYRLKNQVQALEVNSAALEWELRTLQRRLKYQEEMADNRLRASREVLDHIPTLLLAAQDSYTRKAALYANGLTDLIDLLQASTALNKAETDRAVAQVNVWSALLLKAASTGDLRLFDHNLE
jgi:outer membrane protein TolC